MKIGKPFVTLLLAPLSLIFYYQPIIQLSPWTNWQVAALSLIFFFQPVMGNAGTPQNDILLGKFSPATQANFILVEKKYLADKSRTIYLQKEAYESYKKMYQEAAKENIQLPIISGLRTFYQQKSIWEKKYSNTYKLNFPDSYKRAVAILKYSSMPGTSRHHWGTDIDIIALDNQYFIKNKKGIRDFQWLRENAGKYGFCMPYSAKKSDGGSRENGYEMERWHWSYTPQSKNFLKQYNERIHPQDILGFAGAEHAQKINVIGYYVNGIAPECK